MFLRVTGIVEVLKHFLNTLMKDPEFFADESFVWNTLFLLEKRKAANKLLLAGFKTPWKTQQYVKTLIWYYRNALCDSTYHGAFVLPRRIQKSLDFVRVVVFMSSTLVTMKTAMALSPISSWTLCHNTVWFNCEQPLCSGMLGPYMNLSPWRLGFEVMCLTTFNGSSQ